MPHLRQLELQGPLLKPANARLLWSVRLAAPYYSAKLRSEDYVHPLRTVHLDSHSPQYGKLSFRNPRLVSCHVIAGGAAPYENGSDSGDGSEFALLRIGIGQNDVVLHSNNGQGFHTGEPGVDYPGHADFQHILASPLPAGNRWPAPDDANILMPEMRLVNGTIHLAVAAAKLGQFNFLRLKQYDDKAGVPWVKIVLTPDGIVLEANVDFPSPDGTTTKLDGRFLLYQDERDNRLRLKLLSQELDSQSQNAAAWRNAWGALVPPQNINRLPGLRLDLRRSVPPPEFIWAFNADYTGLAPDIEVPGKDVAASLTGPASPNAPGGELTLQTSTWTLSPGPKLETNISPQNGTVTRRTALGITATASLLKIDLLGDDANPGSPAHSLGHDEVQLAAALRAVYDFPEYPPGEIDPIHPVLFGFVPLNRGWLQLPLPNSPTPNPDDDAQLLSSPFSSPPNVLSGFLHFGEAPDLPDVLSAYGPSPTLSKSSAPWSVTVTAAEAVTITVQFDQNGPAGMTALLVNPRLNTLGLLWLSSDRPDALEAIPRLGAGPGRYLDVPLDTVGAMDTATGVPPCLPVTLKKLGILVAPGAGYNIVTRSALELSIGFNPLAWQDAIPSGSCNAVLADANTALTGVSRPADLSTIRKVPPVAWLPHPCMPLAAAMPMTRSASSAVRPLESREFIPFVIRLATGDFDGGPDLKLHWDGAGPAFPTMDFDTTNVQVMPAAKWPSPADVTKGIAMAAFGVPGAELQVAPTDDPARFWNKLGFALRFDLPVLDEAFATATFPPAPALPTSDADLPPLPSPATATALDWKSMMDFWKNQMHRQQLSRVRYGYLGTSYLNADGNLNNVPVTDLLGGAKWNTQVGFAPGTNADDLPYGYAFTAPANPPVPTDRLFGNKALIGYSGQLNLPWTKPAPGGAANATVQVEGYALPTIEDGNYLVDARGAGFKACADNGGWVRAGIARDAAGNVTDFRLLTLAKTVAVTIGAADLKFGFWFKDLPIDNAKNSLISRPAVNPGHAVNPDAWADDNFPFEAMEWRLWPDDQDSQSTVFKIGRDRLPFYGFELEPLQLSQCTVDPANALQSVVLLCRLHLGPENETLETGGNVVRLTLQATGAGDLFVKDLDVNNDPLLFHINCADNNQTRRVTLQASCKWSGKPEFTNATLTVGMFGGEVDLSNPVVKVPSNAKEACSIEWGDQSGGSLPTTLAPGKANAGIQYILITLPKPDGAIPISSPPPPVQPPAIKFLQRWIALLPKGEGGDNITNPLAPVIISDPADGTFNLSLFGRNVKIPKGSLSEGAGTVSFTATLDFSPPLPGYTGTGKLALGFAGRVTTDGIKTGIYTIDTGYFNASWTATGASDAASIVAEARCNDRTASGRDWTGTIKFNVDITLDSCIHWPNLVTPANDAAIPWPTIDKSKNGRETLQFGNSLCSHTVHYTLAGHAVAFTALASLLDATPSPLYLPVFATHTLTWGTPAQNITFTGAENIALGSADTLIPKLDPPNLSAGKTGKDDRSFATRYGCAPSAGTAAPGMDHAGIGELRTVFSGCLGFSFRNAFSLWEKNAGIKNPMVILGGFAGFVDDSPAKLLRLPFLAFPWLKSPPTVKQIEAGTVEVAWADGTASKPVDYVPRTAHKLVSMDYDSLQSAVTDGLPSSQISPALLVEQSFRVDMDSETIAPDLDSRIFFPAAAVGVSSLISHKTGPLSALSLVSCFIDAAKQEDWGSHCRLVTTAWNGEPAKIIAASVTNAAARSAAGSLLVTVGDDLVVQCWADVPLASSQARTSQQLSGAVAAALARAAHPVPRAALVVETLQDWTRDCQQIILPPPVRRPVYRAPISNPIFPEPARGYCRPPKHLIEGWGSGIEEGLMQPARDIDAKNFNALGVSGLAALSRRISMPAAALAPSSQTPAPLWLAEERAPVYQAPGFLKDTPAPPIPWLAPGQTRPRLPSSAALLAAISKLLEAGAPSSNLQWIMPAGATTASIGDRAGVVLARLARLESAPDDAPDFDPSVSRFGLPADSSAASLRTERTPRPGVLPVNQAWPSGNPVTLPDPALNRRPCANRLCPMAPVDALRGPAEMITGDGYDAGDNKTQYGPWAVKIVAAPDWNGVITDRMDGTMPLTVEIDIAGGKIGGKVIGGDPGTPGDKGLSVREALIQLLMSQSGASTLDFTASLVVGSVEISFQRIIFANDTYFLPPAGNPNVFRGSAKIILDPAKQGNPVIGPVQPMVANAMASGWTPPEAEIRFTTYPDWGQPFVLTTNPVFTLTPPVGPSTPLPAGPSRPPVRLHIPLMPVGRSRGMLPLVPATLLFIDQSYDAGLGSKPEAVPKLLPQAPVASLNRGSLVATLYADRSRVNRQGSLVFMIDLAMEKPIPAVVRARQNTTGVDGDLHLQPGDKTAFAFNLKLIKRSGSTADPIPLFFKDATNQPQINLATIHELPLIYLVDGKNNPAPLEAGDVLQMQIAEDTANPISVTLWNPGGADCKVDHLDTAPVNIPMEFILTDDPIIEPPPGLYASLVLRSDSGKNNILSLPLYAQSPLPWRVTLRDPKADFRIGFVRRSAVFIWSLLRPMNEIDSTKIHIVKSDRSGQTYLPETSAEFVIIRKL